MFKHTQPISSVTERIVTGYCFVMTFLTACLGVASVIA